MNNAQIQFPISGHGDKFSLTPIYQDTDGYTHSDTCAQDDVPADQAPALASVVSALVGLTESGRARLAARITPEVIAYPPVR